MFDFLFKMLGSPNQPVVVKAGAVIIDVREPAEYASGHVAGAINIPLSVLPEHVADLKRLSKPLVVYCRSGARSGMARKMLVDAGVEDVINGKNASTVSRILGA
ncbi:rhodanese-like domain-containing protein [uncultured Aquitalea sp.]|uniref:rhodanese-like domain-containing protein n=1 Tax=uncultured Aquitalea sp. TaxID=540272 RepID=UPI0025E12D0A|nr:rhodanese-like domain-containing protein [uncultured Aquitalea sp.]